MPGFTYQWNISSINNPDLAPSPLARVGVIPDAPDRFHVAANFISNPDLRPAGFGGFDLNIGATVPDSPDRPAAFLHISETVPDSPDSWQIAFIDNPAAYPSGGVNVTIGATYSNDMRMAIVQIMWTNRNLSYTREFSTYISQYGMQRYIY